jgi:hypothetical protein
VTDEDDLSLTEAPYEVRREVDHVVDVLFHREHAHSSFAKAARSSAFSVAPKRFACQAARGCEALGSG